MWKFVLLVVTTLPLHQFANAGSLTVNRIKSLDNDQIPSSENNRFIQHDVAAEEEKNTDKKDYNVAPMIEKHNNDLSDEKKYKTVDEVQHETGHEGPIPCTCGVFLSGQFKKGSKEPPKGVPVLTQEMDTPFMNNSVGNRQCTNKCLELRHLPLHLKRLKSEKEQKIQEIKIKQPHYWKIPRIVLNCKYEFKKLLTLICDSVP